TTPATTGETNGIGVGARLGFQYLGLMGGVQYDMGMGSELEATNTTVTTKDDIKKSHLGVFVGYNLPMMLRLWGTYYLDSKIEGDEAAGSDAGIDAIDSTNTWKGGGYGLGVGFTGLPFLSINLEYKTFEYDEQDDTDDPTDTTLNPVVESSEIVLSVSFPINL
ncbi:MAG: outer membrane beta-barrel protein, partial [Bacteriovoracaceae bacterium]|nr:outer membrane beta-barrel protein [Bacteriovoracaceae bacterium]